MLKIYIAKPMEDVIILPFLKGGRETHGTLFQDIDASEYEGILDIVSEIHDADVVLLPHLYKRVSPEYFGRTLKETLEAGKKLIVFANSDNEEEVDSNGTIVFRTSRYRDHMKDNDVMMPGYAEDLGRVDVGTLHKGERPIVGFVGKAGFSNGKDYLRYLLKCAFRIGSQRPGEWFRRRSLKLLESDKDIELRSIIRDKYSGSAKTVELSPEVARKEYIDNIIDSHFTLAPKGYGNFSQRFYETLALGRIPILIDTDIPLPLEDLLAYDEFIVRVAWNDLESLPKRVKDFYQSRTEEEFTLVSAKARKAFAEYLYMPAFLRISSRAASLRR